MTLEKRKNFIINIIYFSIIAVLIYFAVKFLSSYLTPFLIGIFASFIVQKPANFIHKKARIPKGAITIVLVIFTYAFIIAILGLASYLLYVGLSSFVQRELPSYLPTIKSAFDELNLWFATAFKDLPQEAIQTIQNLPETLIDKAASIGGGFAAELGLNLAKATPQMIITIIVTIVASCYIALDYDKVIKFLKAQLSDRALDIITDIKELFTKNIFRMLRCYLILMVITFLELCVFVAILGYKNFAGIAAIIAIVDILPVLGTGTIVIPWSLISLLTGNYFAAILLILAYITITVVRNFLEPRIVGHQIGLNPLVMLIALFVGLRLMGFAGMFLLPLTMLTIVELHKKGKIHIWKNPSEKA